MDVRLADQALGQILIQQGILTLEQLQACLTECREAHLGHVLLRRGLVNVDQLSEALLQQERQGVALKEEPREAVDATSLSGSFGRFTILHRIGLGGTAAVYLAFDENLKRLVALKVLTPHLNPGGTVVDRFIKEAQTLARLSHPNLVRIYDTGTIAGLQYIAMEYVQGRNLEELIDEGKLPADRIAPILSDLCRCVSYAHERGVVHRDLKPSNVMIEDRTDRVVVMDFGIARRMDELTKMAMTGSILGTPSYMSPEQVRGEAGAIDGRTDVYGAGAVLYECLTGRPPFEGKNEREVFEKILSDDPPEFPKPVPEALRRICLKAMEKDKAGRYPTVAEMREDLERHLVGLPVLARPGSMPSVLARKARRHRTAILVSTMAMAAIGGLAAAFVVFQSEHQREARRLAEQGDQLLGAGQPVAALQAFELALKRDPNSGYLKDRKAECRRQILRRDEEARRRALEELQRGDRIARAQRIFVETQEVVTGARRHLYREGEGLPAVRREVEPILPRLEAALKDSPLADGFYLRGRIHQLLGDAALAQASYDRALKIDPAHAMSRIHLGRMLIETAVVEAVQAMDPGRQRRILEERFKEALHHLESVPAGTGFEKKDFDLARGFAQIARRRPEEALESGLRGVREYGDEEFSYLCGVAALRLGDAGRAEEHLGRAIEGRRLYFEAYFLRGVSRQAGGRPKEARDDFRKCVEIHSGHGPAWNNLGVLLMNESPDEARRCFERAIAAEPGLPNGYVNAGILLRARGQPRQAIEMYDLALKVDPLHAEAYHCRGIACSALGDSEGAIFSFTSCLDLEPRHLQALVHRGDAYLRMQRWEEALIDYEAGLRLGELWSLYYGRAVVRANRSDWEGALSDLDQAIARNASHAPAHAWRGAAHVRLGRFEEAVRDLEEAVRLDPAIEPEVASNLRQARRALEGQDKR